MLEWSYEEYYKEQGKNVICGIDEAGRGPLAGPVVAAACILPFGYEIPELNDSKKLSEKKREKLYSVITENAVAYSIGYASNVEIDEINILNATMLAMKRAVDGLNITPDVLLVDGNIARGFDIEAYPIIGGDAKSPSIAAASILAKVTRDRLCTDYEEKYPQYGFLKHKGYSTKLQMDKVREFGPCEIHRKTFLKFYYENR